MCVCFTLSSFARIFRAFFLEFIFLGHIHKLNGQQYLNFVPVLQSLLTSNTSHVSSLQLGDAAEYGDICHGVNNTNKRFHNVNQLTTRLQADRHRLIVQGSLYM